MPGERGIAEIVRHYVEEHWAEGNLTDLGKELHKRQRVGSSTTISAWMNGTQEPKKRSYIVELRKIVECRHPQFGDEAIKVAMPTIGRSPTGGSRDSPPAEATPDRFAKILAVWRSRKKYLVWAGVATGVIAALAAIPWGIRTMDPMRGVHLTVQANPDELVTDARLRHVTGNYLTTLPIDQVPEPPGRRDNCPGRHAWAHSPPISAVDANSTLFKVNIRTDIHDLLLDRATPHFDNEKTAALAHTLLACPGGGGNLPPNILGIDLDTAKVAYYPDGGDATASLNLMVEPGEVASLLVIADAVDHYCEWRLELGFEVGDATIAVTIGPDGWQPGIATSNPGQRPFKTSGELSATAYRFRDGVWQPGR